MKPYRNLFDKYKNGNLEDALIKKLHQLLIDTYFTIKSDLNEDELVYTEGLVIELFSKNDLDARYVQQFRNMLKEDNVLYKKYRLLCNLTEAIKIDSKKSQILESNNEQLQEEKELENILNEAIERVHAEIDAPTEQTEPFNLLENILDFFKSLFLPSNFNIPQVKYAMVAISLVIIAVFIWISIDPGQTGRNEQLIADNLKPSSNFNYGNTRSISFSILNDTISMAAIAYNKKQFNDCINLLNLLLDKKSIQNIDTLSMINYYLGNSYFAIALEEENKEFLNLSLESFKKITPNSLYFYPSKWYSSLVMLKLDNRDESIRFLDTLIQNETFNKKKAKELKKAIIDLE